VALNYYKLGFEVKSQSLGRDSWPVCPNLQATTKLNSQLYWDPKEDIVCLEPLRETFEPSYFPGATSHSCKHLCKHYIATMDPEALQLEMRGELWKAFYPLASRGFSGLESITVVLANDFRIRYPLYAPMTDQEYSNDYRALIQRSQPPSHPACSVMPVLRNPKLDLKPVNMIDGALQKRLLLAWSRNL
jgi:hypothetical protein